MILTFSSWLDGLPLNPWQSWLVVTGVTVICMGMALAIIGAIGLLMEAAQAWWERRQLKAFIAQLQREAAEEADRRRLHALTLVGSRRLGR